MIYQEIKFWIVFIAIVLFMDKWITDYLNLGLMKEGLMKEEES